MNGIHIRISDFNIYKNEEFLYIMLSNTDNKEIYTKLMKYYAPQTTKTFNELYERSKHGS